MNTFFVVYNQAFLSTYILFLCSRLSEIVNSIFFCVPVIFLQSDSYTADKLGSVIFVYFYTLKLHSFINIIPRYLISLNGCDFALCTKRHSCLINSVFLCDKLLFFAITESFIKHVQGHVYCACSWASSEQSTAGTEG